ncbi:MAG: transcription elongation factor GreA [Patescibacteria group bacterium]
MTEIYLSAEKYKELEEELKLLTTVKRREVASELEFATSLGDLSENAEYHEAREKQADLEARISQIKEMLKNATIISDKHGDIVEVGSTVVVKKTNSDKEVEYNIVGSAETDMKTGKISHESPLGSALLGFKKGDTVKVRTPNGEIEYKIKEIK